MSEQSATELPVSIPLIQAPMAGVQDWRLAVAVSSAGALGSIPCGMLTATQVEAEVNAFRAACDKPLNLNFFCHQMQEPSAEIMQSWQSCLDGYYREADIQQTEGGTGALRMPYDAEMADVVERLRPQVVSFHFGLPQSSLVTRLKAAGCLIISTATTLEEGLWLQHNGADMVIAQGYEAGGHRGMFLTRDLATQTGTLALVSLLVSQLNIPVIAAGGIASGQDIKAALAMGAVAAQLGTTYLLCDEAKTSALHRQQLKDVNAVTALSNVFSGRPARGIRNRLMIELGDINSQVAPFPYASAALAPLKQAAEAQGQTDFSSLWSGQNRSGCCEISAAELTQQLWRAAE